MWRGLRSGFGFCREHFCVRWFYGCVRQGRVRVRDGTHGDARDGDVAGESVVRGPVQLVAVLCELSELDGQDGERSLSMRRWLYGRARD